MKATESAVAEILGIGVGIAQIIADEHRGLPGKLEPFAAFETSDEVVEAHHEGGGLQELSAVFFTGAARQLPLFPGNLPAHGKFEFAAATRADQL